MNSNAKKDLKDVFHSILSSVKKWRFVALFVLLFLTICCVIPQNKAISFFISLKREAQMNITHNIGSFRDKLFARTYLIQQLEDAQSKIAELEVALAMQRVKLSEYKNLGQMLNLIPDVHKFHTSKILKFSNSLFENSIFISGGSDKYTKGDIIISEGSVAGIIEQTLENYSIVKLFWNPDFKIPVRGVDSNNRYILTGSGEVGFMRIQYSDNSVLGIVEEDIVTSGEGGVFPANLMVGHLTKKGSTYFLFKDLNFYKNSFVMVLSKE